MKNLELIYRVPDPTDPPDQDPPTIPPKPEDE